MRLGSPVVSARVYKLAALLWCLGVVAGAVLLWLPEAPKTPLVLGGAWATNPVFRENDRPKPGDVSPDILAHPESRFFRSWPPSTSATVRSPRFFAPRYLAIPFAGYPTQPRLGLWLECLGNGRRMDIARGNAHETWVERTLRIPDGWCRAPVQVVARYHPTPDYVAFGTPFASGVVSWLKESVFVLLAIHALAVALLLGPGLLLAWRTVPGERHLIGVVALTPALGYLQFFAWYYVPPLGATLSVLVAAAGVAGIVTAVRAVRSGRWPACFTRPLALFALLSLAYVMLLYAGNVGAGSHDATYRFDPAIWSTDNQLSQGVSEAMYRGRPLKGVLGVWHVSDRPPLQSGLFLLGRPLWAGIVDHATNARLNFYFYQITGMAAATLWVVPVWLLLGCVGRSDRQRAAVVGLMATLGPIVFNSLYIWPKMLAGTLVLAGCLLLTRSLGGIRHPLRSVAIAGTLIALGVMSHSGVVFTLPPALLVFGWTWIRRDRWMRAAAALTAAAALVVAPWLYWQRTADPPGNALTKYVVSGSFGFDQPEVGVLEAARRAYAALSFEQWWETHTRGLLMISGLRVNEADALWLFGRDFDAAGRRRLDDFLAFGRSMRVANVGWLVLGWIWWTRRRRTSEDVALARECAAWCGIGAVGLVLNVVGLWAMHTTHMQSYLSLLLVPAGLCTALLIAPRRVRRLIVAAHLAYFAVVWLWSPLAHAQIAAGPSVAALLATALLVHLGLSADDTAPAIEARDLQSNA